MISVAVRLVANHLGTLSTEMAAGVRRARRNAGLRIEADWKADVRVDTGNYRRSIHTDDGADHTVVSSNVDYALPNEYGTSRGMAARPSATKAGEKHRRTYAADVEQVLHGR